jgi:leader peptidase (prepilin peptidase)/N-methyltransferase
MTAGTAEVPTAESQRPLTLGRFTVAGMVLAVVLSFAVFGFTPDAVVGSVFASTLIVLAAIDLERRIIPNRIVLPATAAVLVLNIAAHPSQWVEWLGAAAAAFGFFLLVALINPKGLGMGDVKLALLLGAGLGWDVAVALVLGTFAAAAYGIILVLTRPGAGAKTAFAMGPFLAGGALFALFFVH